jgi:tetratricopeptide (TPR) repeat protein
MTILKGNTLVKKGEIDNALKIAEKLIDASHDFRYDAIVLKSKILWRKGFFDEALELSLGIVDDLSDRSIDKKELYGLNLNNIGIIYVRKGELDTALEYYQKSLRIFEEIGNRQDIAYALNNIGNIYSSKGDFDTALEYYQKSVQIFEEVGNKRDIAYALNNIGVIYYSKGKLDTALEYYQKSLLIKEGIGKKQDIAGSFNNIGNIYKVKGELDNALDYYQKSLQIREGIGNPLELSQSLFSIIDLMLIKDQKLAKHYLTQLQQSAKENDNKVISQRSRLAEALILKSSNRGRLIAKAQDILEIIVKEEIVKFTITRDAMLNLCEILLIEYKNFEEDEILDEAFDLLDQLYAKAQEQSSFSLSIESLILKARIKIIHGEFDQATKFLEQARLFAEERGITGLIPKIEHEKKRMVDNIGTWTEMLEKTRSAGERLEQMQIVEYLQDIKKIHF